MIEIKRDSDHNITNFTEIKKELQDAAGEIHSKVSYYARRYYKKAGRAIIEQFGSAYNYRKESKEVIWWDLIDTRKIMINDLSVEFFIWSTMVQAIDIHILIETKSKKDYILLYYTGVGVSNEFGKEITLFIPGTPTARFIPIVVEDHFITRYLQRQEFEHNWKSKMMMDFGFLSDYVDRAGMIVGDDFKPLTNAEVIEAEKSISTLIKEGNTYEARDRIIRSCLYLASRLKFAFIMIPPTRDGMYVIKTYLVPEQLKERQKEILRYQELVWQEAKARQIEAIEKELKRKEGTV